jgi:extracellular factor (EF) 3-hydroxypalmitic acid methyl ester biosynthesis protein
MKRTPSLCAPDEAWLRPGYAAERFVETLAAIERQATRERRPLPALSERVAARTAFWKQLIPELEHADLLLSEGQLEYARGQVRAIVHPWMLRHSLWARAWHKPRGFPAEFTMLESIYDLAVGEHLDPAQPVVVNLMTDLARSIPAVNGAWHRRTWFARLIRAGLKRADAQRRLRVADLAGAGSRYLHDVMEEHPRAIEATFIDQDPAALAFVRSWLPAPARGAVTMLCAPVRRISEWLPRDDVRGQGYDVVVCSGLLDYLPLGQARALLDQMTGLPRPGGVLAVSNLAPDPGSRAVMEWICDWASIRRTEAQLGALFPPHVPVRLSSSRDGRVAYAEATVS